MTREKLVGMLRKGAIHIGVFDYCDEAEAAADMLEADAARISELEADNKRLHAQLERMHPNPADYRYWEGRYRDEVADNNRLREALKDHNDTLRSCFQVIARKGQDTNWDALIVEVKNTLIKHKEITNAARAALEGK